MIYLIGHIVIWLGWWFVWMKFGWQVDGSTVALFTLFWPISFPIMCFIEFFDWLGDMLR